MMDDSDSDLQSGKSEVPDYSKIPADFPRPEIVGAVSGFQPKLLLTTYRGKFYTAGCTPPELYNRLDRCEHLAQQLAVKALESKHGKRAAMLETEILDQYLPRLIATKWTSEPEARFVIRRAAQILDWPAPPSAHP